VFNVYALVISHKRVEATQFKTCVLPFDTMYAACYNSTTATIGIID